MFSLVSILVFAADWKGDFSLFKMVLDWHSLLSFFCCKSQETISLSSFSHSSLCSCRNKKYHFLCQKLKKQKCLPVSCSHLSALLTCAWNLWQPRQNCSELFIVEKVGKKNTQTNNLIKQRKAISGELNSLFLYWIVLNSWNLRIALCFLFCCPLRLS